jgi:hypothetical protein
VVISHVTGDFAPETWTQLIETYRSRGIPAQARSHGEIARFFEGLDLVGPGIQVAHRWRPDDAVPAGLTDPEVSVYGGVGRKKWPSSPHRVRRMSWRNGRVCIPLARLSRYRRDLAMLVHCAQRGGVAFRGSGVCRRLGGRRSDGPGELGERLGQP